MKNYFYQVHILEKKVRSFFRIYYLAGLCACRIFVKCPDMVENYLDKFEDLLKEQKNHSVLLTVISMMIEVTKTNLNELVKYVPLLIRILKGLISSSYQDNDISGIADPFLQVKLLRLLRILGTGNQKASEMMNDVLVQIATHTESNRNAGHAILYEVVQTILNIESDTVLKNLAITILGKFLVNKDNNIRYVALKTFNSVSQVDQNSVTKHLKTILECLKDYDISIKKRALRLAVEISNKDNSEMIVEEMLVLLEKTDPEFKEELTHSVCLILEKYSKSEEYRINSMIKVFKISPHVKDEHITKFILLLGQAPEKIQSNTVNQLFTSLQSKYLDPLGQVTSWSIGEYGDYLNNKKEDILNILTTIIEKQPLSTIYTKELAATALLKLVVRFNGEQIDYVKDCFKRYKTSPILELQQRSDLYLKLLDTLSTSERSQVLARIPPIQKKGNDIFKVEQKEVIQNKVDTTPSTDILLNLFGGSEKKIETISTPQNHNLLNLFTVEDHTKYMKIFDKDGVQVEFEITSPIPNVYNIVSQFSNSTNNDLSPFEFLVAVPKNLQLKIKKATSDTVPKNSQKKVNQEMQITNLQPEKSLLMKVKIKYKSGDKSIEEDGNIKDFPKF